MELVEGENLKGPLSLETAINYVKQIADALETAHEKGVVHSDLKPADIKITPLGRREGTSASWFFFNSHFFVQPHRCSDEERWR